MSKAILTRWFRRDVKPAHVGVYQQKDGMGQHIGYQFWDGEFWYAWSSTIEGAILDGKRGLKAAQADPWRGLTERAATTNASEGGEHG